MEEVRISDWPEPPGSHAWLPAYGFQHELLDKDDYFGTNGECRLHSLLPSTSGCRKSESDECDVIKYCCGFGLELCGMCVKLPEHVVSSFVWCVAIQRTHHEGNCHISWTYAHGFHKLVSSTGSLENISRAPFLNLHLKTKLIELLVQQSEKID